jgi:dTDP-4-dehydrorhamnose reductase
MRILLTGRSGQVGWELVRTLAPLGTVAAFGHAELDLADPDAIRARMREFRPDVIVNAGAYTSVDLAESQAEAAQAVNGVAPGVLAEEARRQSGLFIHYSTDYVFDGSKKDPYVEGDAVNPLNVYGRTKLAGERAVEEIGGRYLILRASWVYAARGRNFLNTIRRLIRERESLNVVDDQIGAPTWARLLAEATAQIVSILNARQKSGSPDTPSGTYHIACAGETSWHGWARAIAALEGQRGAAVNCEIRPIPTEQYPTPARRPLNSRLDCTALRRDFGLALPDWEWALRAATETG